MATKKAAKKKASKPDALTVKLSSKQQAQLKQMSKGAINAKTLKLRKAADITDFLARVVRGGSVKNEGFAPPPKDTYWV